LLDRIDLHVEVPKVPQQMLRATESAGPGSTAIRQRVEAARQRQLQRAGKLNRAMSTREMEHFCQLEKNALALLEQATERLGLSARAYHRIIKVARTIADLGDSATIETPHVSEAIAYRRLDRRSGTALA
jgi:magnesium chelatase family protein